MESLRRFFRWLLKGLTCAGDVDMEDNVPYRQANAHEMLELAPCRRFACTASDPNIELYMYEPRSSIPNALRDEESARRQRQLAAFRELYYREQQEKMNKLVEKSEDTEASASALTE